jgi:hypothetical protein
MLLFAAQVKAEVRVERLAGTAFLIVETDAMDEDAMGLSEPAFRRRFRPA